MDEKKIIQECQDGNLEMFSQIYNLYIEKIYSFVYRKTTNKEVAEDIVSEVFLSAINSISHFRLDEESSLSSWLYRIAYNKVIDFYRKQEHHQTQELGDYLEISCYDDIAQNIDNKNKLKEVLLYMKSLKSEHSEILLMRIWDNLSYSEISQITGKKVDNCKKIVSRNLKNIAGEFLFLCLLILFI